MYIEVTNACTNSSKITLTPQKLQILRKELLEAYNWFTAYDTGYVVDRIKYITTLKIES